MVKKRDCDAFASPVLLLRMRGSHNGFFDMCNNVLHYTKCSQRSQAALNNLRLQAKSKSVILGSFIRMCVTLPVITGDASATRLVPCAMRRYPPDRRKCRRKQAPQITVITLKQVLPPALMQ